MGSRLFIGVANKNSSQILLVELLLVAVLVTHSEVLVVFCDNDSREEAATLKELFTKV